MSSDSQHFKKLVDQGQPVGEVIAVNSFLVELSGLTPASRHTLVVFEDGSKGFVQHILEDKVIVLHLGTKKLRVGALAVVQYEGLVTKVGKDYIGRVISVIGEPLDGQGAIAADAVWPIFNAARPINEREALSKQLETGVTMIDALFPIVRGQRMALLGESKAGKSTLAAQLAINQKSTDQVVVYVMIAKRKSDIDMLLARLNENQAMGKAIVVVSTVAESLALSYLAPYVGCALAEYLWQKLGQDTLIIYDDLTTHAHIYREIALLSGVSPGRDSYPGDIFYAHSSLMERAGRLKVNHAHLTAVPLVLAAAGDITAYLPTNIMSMTDGQWILDMELFHTGWRPSISPSLSVTRVGGIGHSDRQKAQAGRIAQSLAAYDEAREFAHFGSGLSATLNQTLQKGSQLQALFTQAAGEVYSLPAQQLMLDVVLDTTAANLDITKLKRAAVATGQLLKKAEDYPNVLEELRRQVGLAGAK